MDKKEKLKTALDQIHAEESLKTSTKSIFLKKYTLKKRNNLLLFGNLPPRQSAPWQSLSEEAPGCSLPQPHLSV